MPKKRPGRPKMNKESVTQPDPTFDRQVQGISLNNIKKVDKLLDGNYNLILRDGSSVQASLDIGEEAMVESHFRAGEPHASKINDGIPSDLAAALSNRNPLERNLGSWMEVEFKSTLLRGYWPTKDKIPVYKSMGYVMATPDLIKNYEQLFAHLNPGDGLSPVGSICYQGHYLMVTTKENAAKIQERYYRDRPIQHVQTEKTIHLNG